MTTTLEHWLDRAAVGLWLVLVLLTAWGTRQLPGRIPVHFSLAGEADRWGRPTTLWLVPLLALLPLTVLWLARQGYQAGIAGWLTATGVALMLLTALWFNQRARRLVNRST